MSGTNRGQYFPIITCLYHGRVGARVVIRKVVKYEIWSANAVRLRYVCVAVCVSDCVSDCVRQYEWGRAKDLSQTYTVNLAVFLDCKRVVKEDVLINDFVQKGNGECSPTNKNDFVIWAGRVNAWTRRSWWSEGIDIQNKQLETARYFTNKNENYSSSSFFRQISIHIMKRIDWLILTNLVGRTH